MESIYTRVLENIKARRGSVWLWNVCVHVCVYTCVCVCGHMLWWLHCKGFMLMLESHRVIMHCCMMGMPFTSYIWAKEARRRNTDTQREENVQSGECRDQNKKLVKKWKGRDSERKRAKGWKDREGDRRLIDVKDALSPPRHADCTPGDRLLTPRSSQLQIKH